MEVLKIPKIPKKYDCSFCHYTTSNSKDYSKHLLTRKHQNCIKGSILEENGKEKSQKIPKIFTCVCGKTCNTHSGMWKHKKTCDDFNTQNEENMLVSLVMEVVKQNHDFKEMLFEQNKTLVEQNSKLIEVCKNGVGNNNTINSHNKAFNLNVFLNEECKDAMSITDFVNSIKLQLSDLEAVGKLGFVNGISNIIIRNLRALDVHMRPIHCTDTKRETMYVKGQDAWEKEGDDNKQLRLAIKRVAKNNFCCLELFKEKHPDCINWDSKHGDHYLKLRMEALGGRGNEDCDNENKIIRKIARETTIDKNY